MLSGWTGLRDAPLRETRFRGRGDFEKRTAHTIQYSSPAFGIYNHSSTVSQWREHVSRVPRPDFVVRLQFRGCCFCFAIAPDIAESSFATASSCMPGMT